MPNPVDSLFVFTKWTVRVDKCRIPLLSFRFGRLVWTVRGAKGRILLKFGFSTRVVLFWICFYALWLGTALPRCQLFWRCLWSSLVSRTCVPNHRIPFAGSLWSRGNIRFCPNCFGSICHGQAVKDQAVKDQAVPGRIGLAGSHWFSGHMSSMDSLRVVSVSFP